MVDPCAQHNNPLEAGVSSAAAEIGVFAIEERSLVEQADPLEDFATNQEATACYPVRLQYLRWRRARKLE
jgi:hypothetical protein